MFHPISSWPQRNRRLFVACAVAVAVLVIWNLFFISPLRRNYRNMRNTVRQKEAQLDAAGWPKDEQALIRQLDMAMKTLNGDEEQALQGLTQVTEDIIDLASATFRERIEMSNPDGIVAFMDSVTKIDYKLLYDNVAAEFAKHGVTLDATYFGLADDSQEPIWRMIFKLWTAEELVTLAAKNHLTIVSDENGIAKVRALSPKCYALTDGEDADPYLLEFPVRITVEGASYDLLSFINDLQSEQRFMPVKQISVRTTPPAIPAAGGDVAVATLRSTLTCSSFFKLP